MCGIFGAITKQGVELTDAQKAQRQNIVTALGFAMQERGDHSTGVAVVRGGELYMRKRAVPALEFLNWKKAKRLLRDNPSMVIGHTRFATTGIVSDENAHPFLIGDICGVHNGQVSNYRDFGDDLTVDSQAIFTALNNADGDFIKAFAQLRGGMAVAWMNVQKPSEINLVAHTNPLALCRVKSLETIFYCSTKEAMQIAVHAGVGYEHNEIFEPIEDIVYTINGDLKVAKMKVEFKGWEYNGQPYTAGNNATRGYDDDDRDWDKGYAQGVGIGEPDETIRDAVWGDMALTECELCLRTYGELTPAEKARGIMYNYQDDVWVCAECAYEIGAYGLNYQKMTWAELIDDKTAEAEYEIQEGEPPILAQEKMDEVRDIVLANRKEKTLFAN